MKMKYVVWWFEVAKFDGKITRNYRDFDLAYKACEFYSSMVGHRGLGIDRIRDCTWHHSNAYVNA